MGFERASKRITSIYMTNKKIHDDHQKVVPTESNKKSNRYLGEKQIFKKIYVATL